jgi:hypothetical protein
VNGSGACPLCETGSFSIAASSQGCISAGAGKYPSETITYSSPNMSTTAAFNCVAASSDLRKFIVGTRMGSSGGKMYLSVDSGATWAEVAESQIELWTGVAASGNFA